MIIGLDHAGIAVHDLEQARLDFERLGFRMTPLSEHAGTLGPGQPVQNWGSANHCAMLRQGYLEVLGPHGESPVKRIHAMLERYEGPHIIAFRSADADDCYRALCAAGAPAEPIKRLERQVPQGDGQAMARFRLVGLAAPPYSEARVQVTEHQTPEAIWQPQWLEHPNTARALTDVIYQSPEPEAMAARYHRHLGGSLTQNDRGLRLQTARGAIHFVADSLWRRLQPDAPALPSPCPVALGVAVASRDALLACLDRAGVAHVRDDQWGIGVAGGVCHGATLFFREE